MIEQKYIDELEEMGLSTDVVQQHARRLETFGNNVDDMCTQSKCTHAGHKRYGTAYVMAGLRKGNNIDDAMNNGYDRVNHIHAKNEMRD
ncbi:MAG: hypothetical protein FWE38_00595 [Firmicutes bacterium]|nr:hypothetical protein [Bacillota bacterium]